MMCHKPKAALHTRYSSVKPEVHKVDKVCFFCVISYCNNDSFLEKIGCTIVLI